MTVPGRDHLAAPEVPALSDRRSRGAPEVCTPSIPPVPDDYTFRVAERSGKRTIVEFSVEDGGVELLVNRNLYQRVGDPDDG